MIAALSVALACNDRPSEPTSINSAPPQAVLRIEAGGITPPLGISGYTPFLFDASQSPGAGLSYLLELGDGDTATQAVVSHVANRPGQFTARLQVTDQFGRTATTSVSYCVANVHTTAGFDAWGATHRTGGPVFGGVVLNVRQEGAALSGRYHDYPPGGGGIQSPTTGALTGFRGINLRTDDGKVEMAGTFEWRPDQDPVVPPFLCGQSNVVLRMAVPGGVTDGRDVEFHYEFGD
jgi:hypothetical protein